MDPLPANALANRTCIVTGATGTLGAAVVEVLARHGAEVVMIARDATRAEALRERLARSADPARLHLEIADLAEREQVKSLVGRFMGRHSRLDAIVHAAGTLEPERRETDEGYERTWATNVLGPYQLTSRFTEMLRYCRPARVVTLASSHAGGLELGDPQFKLRSYRPWAAYTASQQALRMVSWALADGLDPDVVTLNVVDPGPVRSPLFDRASGPAGLTARLYRRAAGREALAAAASVVRAVADPALAGVSGRLFRDGREVSCRWRHSEDRQPLFNLCANSTRVQPEFDSNIWRDADSVIVEVRKSGPMAGG